MLRQIFSKPCASFISLSCFSSRDIFSSVRIRRRKTRLDFAAFNILASSVPCKAFKRAATSLFSPCFLEVRIGLSFVSAPKNQQAILPDYLCAHNGLHRLSCQPKAVNVTSASWPISSLQEGGVCQLILMPSCNWLSRAAGQYGYAEPELNAPLPAHGHLLFAKTRLAAILDKGNFSGVITIIDQQIAILTPHS